MHKTTVVTHLPSRLQVAVQVGRCWGAGGSKDSGRARWKHYFTYPLCHFEFEVGTKGHDTLFNQKTKLYKTRGGGGVFVSFDLVKQGATGFPRVDRQVTFSPSVLKGEISG